MGFKSLVEGVQDNILVIPEYQRKYRWTKEQVEELATSLIRDLPIPQFIHFEMNWDSQKFGWSTESDEPFLLFYWKVLQKSEGVGV